MIREHQIDAARQQQFAAIITLSYIYESGGELPMLLEGEDVHLEPTLVWALERGHLRQVDERYQLTDSGSLAVNVYRAQCREFLRTFDIFAFVDLEEAEFAYEKFYEFETEEEWDEYIEDERWADLRIAVGEFKGIDPLLIVFLSFVHEGLFAEGGSWQRDLHDADLWMEVQELCNCSVAIDDLAYEDPDDGHVSGEEVMEDIIREGAEMNLELKALEDELSADEGGEDDEDHEEKILDIEAYYAPYVEPTYLASEWTMSWKL